MCQSVFGQNSEPHSAPVGHRLVSVLGSGTSVSVCVCMCEWDCDWTAPKAYEEGSKALFKFYYLICVVLICSFQKTTGVYC